MLPIVVNFEGSFVLFHKIMFNNDYWIFDPNLDPVINILPEEFFFHAGLMILILIIIASLNNYLIYRFLKESSKLLSFKNILIINFSNLNNILEFTHNIIIIIFIMR